MAQKAILDFFKLYPPSKGQRRNDNSNARWIPTSVQVSASSQSLDLDLLVESEGESLLDSESTETPTDTAAANLTLREILIKYIHIR